MSGFLISLKNDKKAKATLKGMNMILKLRIQNCKRGLLTALVPPLKLPSFFRLFPSHKGKEDKPSPNYTT